MSELQSNEITMNGYNTADATSDQFIENEQNTIVRETIETNNGLRRRSDPLGRTPFEDSPRGSNEIIHNAKGTSIINGTQLNGCTNGVANNIKENPDVVDNIRGTNTVEVAKDNFSVTNELANIPKVQIEVTNPSFKGSNVTNYFTNGVEGLSKSSEDVVPTAPARASRSSVGETRAMALRRSQPSLSSMEEENLRERRRTSVLRECRRQLDQAGSNAGLTRDMFRRCFQSKVIHL